MNIDTEITHYLPQSIVYMSKSLLLGFALILIIGQQQNILAQQTKDAGGSEQVKLNQRFQNDYLQNLKDLKRVNDFSQDKEKSSSNFVQEIGGFPEINQAQAWNLTDNPNSKLTFALTGTPVYAGDVNDDGVNDYVYIDESSRDERTSELEDHTGKTALFFGGTPKKREDHFYYEALTPVGDINGDGTDDAILLSESTFTFYSGSSSGYSETESKTDSTIDKLGLNQIVGFNDFDNDGYEDVLLYNNFSYEFAILYGANMFSDVSLKSYSLEVGSNMYAYHAADLNGDSTGSVVRLANAQQGVQIGVYEFESQDSVMENQTFIAENLDNNIDASDYNMALVDINGDNNKELAVSSNTDGIDSVFVYPAADTANKFEETPIMSDKDDATPIGDLDEDGNADFYTYEDSTDTRYISFGPDNLSDGLTFDTPIPYADSTVGRVEYRVHEGFGDVTGDGRSDAVLGFTHQVDKLVGRRYVSVNSSRELQKKEDITFDRAHVYDEIVETNDIGDFNDDGTTDFIMLRFSLNQGEIFFGGSSISSTPDLTLQASRPDDSYLNSTSGDFNGDGIPDIAIGYNTGTRIDIFYGGSNADAQVDHIINTDNFDMEGVYMPRNIGDVNNDGIDDLIATNLGFNNEQQQLAIFFGGSSMPDQPSIKIEMANGSWAGGMVAGDIDLNGDDIDDFVVGDPSFSDTTGNAQGRSIVYFGGDDPSFNEPDLELRPQDLGSFIRGYSAGLTVGDFNGDGIGDIAAVPYFTFGGDGLSVSIFHGGTGMDDSVDNRMSLPASTGMGTDRNGDSIMDLLFYGNLTNATDIDGNGSDELVLYATSPANAILFSPASDTMPQKIFRSPNQDDGMGNSFYNKTAVGDFTGNGTTDFVFTQPNDDNDAAQSSRVYRYPVSTVTSLQSQISVPESYKVSQNYPNPFNPSTKIRYSIPKSGKVELKVYNMAGRQVATLVDGSRTAGSYTVNFNAGNLASGVYIYRIEAGSFSQTKKMILLK